MMRLKAEKPGRKLLTEKEDRNQGPGEQGGTW